MQSELSFYTNLKKILTFFLPLARMPGGDNYPYLPPGKIWHNVIFNVGAALESWLQRAGLKKVLGRSGSKR